MPKAVLLTTLPPSTQCTPKSVLHFETINPRSKRRDDHIYSVHEYRICICPLRSRVTISLHPSPRPNCIPTYAIQKGAGTCCSPLKKKKEVLPRRTDRMTSYPPPAVKVFYRGREEKQKEKKLKLSTQPKTCLWFWVREIFLQRSYSRGKRESRRAKTKNRWE